MSEEKKKIKVCIITAILPPAYGGAEVAAFKYAGRLYENEEYEVIMIGWDRTGLYMKSNLHYEFVYPVRFSENPKDAKGIFIYFQQLYHIWRCFLALSVPMWRLRNRYDYIHNFNSGFAFNRTAIFIAKILGKKVITETSLIGDDDPISLGRFKSWKDYLKPKFIRYKFYKMADRYVSKSEVITDLFRRSEIPMNKVVQIPYSVDTSKFFPINGKEKCELRLKLGLPERDIIILFVGGINSRKGVHYLLDAFIGLEKKFPELKLIVAGPTYKYDQNYIIGIKQKIISNNLGSKIYLTEKNISNVEEYMQASDIFVLPSKHEGFPISIIEAMSCALTVVASDIPEISKAQIKDSEDGFVFPVGNVEKLEEIMENLILHREKLKIIGKAARKKVLENWSSEIIDSSYRNLYLSLLNEN